LFDDAHKRRFGLVVLGSGPFYPGTNGPTIAYLQRLASYGVHFHSCTEAHLSTDNELVRDLLLAVLSSLARQEL